MKEGKKSTLSLQEETRNGYCISAQMKKVWSIELDMLCELNRVCRELQIRYFLDSGTLLGAIRDGHFIPWDDDIDVIMLRDDYEVLKENSHLFQDEYMFQCAYTDDNYPYGHAQIRKKDTCAMIPYMAKSVRFNQGIFIDIFVLDGVTENKKELEAQFREKEKIKRKMDIIGIPTSTKPINKFIKMLLRWVYIFFCPKMSDMFHEYEKICMKYNNSQYVDKIMFRKEPEKVYYIKKDWFDQSVDVSFEGLQFPVPAGYDHVLKTYYGNNYMKPAKAPSMHGGLILNTEKSYIEVLKEM